MDATERFDLIELNTLPLVELGHEDFGGAEVRRRLEARANDLLTRVKQETEDLPVAGAFLRELLLQWYRDSPELPNWSEVMPRHWGGLFADSRYAGGKLQPWIVRRLLMLARGSRRGEAIGGKLLHHLVRSRAHDPFLERPPAQTWAAEAAQAVLDDLASHPRIPGTSRVSLVRLSELAQRRRVENLNQALGMLLDGPDRGPFVLLHPNRYPDCDLVAIRAPSPGASGPALSYALVLQRAGSTPPVAISAGLEVTSTLSMTDLAASVGAEGSVGDPWELSDRPKGAWRPLLESFKASHQRLPAPPKDYRQRGTYRSLRELVVEDEGARRTFSSVKWRGRPSGLLLLTALLADGELACEVSTDYEYLDSELSDLEDGRPDRRPDPPRWRVREMCVVREGDFRSGYHYRVERSAAADRPG